MANSRQLRRYIGIPSLISEFRYKSRNSESCDDSAVANWRRALGDGAVAPCNLGLRREKLDWRVQSGPSSVLDLVDIAGSAD